MKILAHRGFWTSSNKFRKNSKEALLEALDNDFGFESDLRDYHGKLVISHDIADETSMNAEELFRFLAQKDNNYCFAINVKSDGLAELLLEALTKYKLNNYFTFDMSIPQMLDYRRKGLRYFPRQSEYEKSPTLYEEASGIWLDAFLSEEWITKDIIEMHLHKRKNVCLVSPELHGREFQEFWSRIRSYDLNSNELYLCTDYPDKAKVFFRS